VISASHCYDICSYPRVNTITTGPRKNQEKKASGMILVQKINVQENKNQKN